MTYVENPFKMFHKIVYDDTDMTIEDVLIWFFFLIFDLFVTRTIQVKF
jgi:hypothetical protein